MTGMIWFSPSVLTLWLLFDWLLLTYSYVLLHVFLSSAAAFCFYHAVVSLSSSLHPTHTAPPVHCDRPLTDPILLSSFSLSLPSFQVLASLPPCPSPAPRSNPVPLPQSYEPDELTEEMAHLEGLMKDLNAITTAP